PAQIHPRRGDRAHRPGGPALLAHHVAGGGRWRTRDPPAPAVVSPIANPTPAQATGGDAEERATALLARHGLAIIERNYRPRLGEIDIVARDGEYLVFVEVRSRAASAYGGALASITPR